MVKLLLPYVQCWAAEDLENFLVTTDMTPAELANRLPGTTANLRRYIYRWLNPDDSYNATNAHARAIFDLAVELGYEPCVELQRLANHPEDQYGLDLPEGPPPEDYVPPISRTAAQVATSEHETIHHPHADAFVVQAVYRHPSNRNVRVLVVYDGQVVFQTTNAIAHHDWIEA